MINLGIIGSGNIVKQFIDATKNINDINLYAFFSRSEGKAKRFKDENDFEKIYTNLQEMSTSNA